MRTVDDADPFVFITAVDRMATYIHDWALRKGFWFEERRAEEIAAAVMGVETDTQAYAHEGVKLRYNQLRDLVNLARSTAPRNDAELLALMHSELSEALEGLRDGNPPAEKIEGFTQVEEELADLVIRVLDTCHARGYRLGEAIVAKMAHNEGRPWKHGRAF